MKKIFSIILAIMLLLSNSSFTLATHYCGGEAVESKLMLVKHNLDCGISAMLQGCEEETPEGRQFSPEPCCQNEYQTFQVDDAFKTPLIQALSNLMFVAAFAHTFLFPASFAAADLPQYTYYTPPLPKRNIQVLFQSFLI